MYFEKTALILDDNEQCRAVVREIFEDYGFRVVTYPDAITFLNLHQSDCCSSHPETCFDIILTDNRMPGMKGIELLERIMAGDCLLKGAEKAILSGDLSEDDLLRAKQLDCKVFHKPDFAELYSWLAEHAPAEDFYAAACDRSAS